MLDVNQPPGGVKMLDKNRLRKQAKFLAAPLMVVAVLATTMGAANANVGLCSPRLISENIKNAVLALKATEHCAGTELPYSHDQATIWVDDMRCGSEASNLIDELLMNYDREYRTIMRTDAGQVVCKMAAEISFD